MGASTLIAITRWSQESAEAQRAWFEIGLVRSLYAIRFCSWVRLHSVG